MISMSSNKLLAPQDGVHENAQAVNNKEAAAQLSEDDLERVAQYLDSPIHRIERKPFRPWLMMASLVGVVTLLSFLSLAISRWVLP